MHTTYFPFSVHYAMPYMHCTFSHKTIPYTMRKVNTENLLLVLKKVVKISKMSQRNLAQLFISDLDIKISRSNNRYLESS